MEIRNPAVQADLDAGRKLRLSLGSGKRQPQGFYNLDLVPLPGVDVVADLNEPLALLPDNSVEAVQTRHTLEHIRRFLELMSELHRVVCPGGLIDVTVPHFSNPYGYSDPTHVRFFGLYSFFYFSDERDQPRRKVPNFYLPARFKVDRVRFRLPHKTLAEKAVRGVMEPLINRGIGWLDWYERRACRLWPADEVQYLLRPVKDVPAAMPLARAA